MVLVTLLQKFDLVLQDPAYELQIKQTLTIKPKDFYVRAIPRAGRTQLLALPSSALLQSRGGLDADQTTPAGSASEDPTLTQPLYVLYGSNTGTSETFAQRIATDAAAHGTSLF